MPDLAHRKRQNEKIGGDVGDRVSDKEIARVDTNGRGCDIPEAIDRTARKN